jgi:hypothetical protein
MFPIGYAAEYRRDELSAPGGEGERTGLSAGTGSGISSGSEVGIHDRGRGGIVRSCNLDKQVPTATGADVSKAH